jgi:hypothetical protein
MNFNQIRKMATGMGINTYRMKKHYMIQEIQKAENNVPCFGTSRIDSCNELDCMWRKDCISSNHDAIAKPG